MMTPMVDVHGSGVSSGTGLHGRPSVDEWVIAVLQERGTQTLDQLGKLLPEANWAQLFLAIDRLSRNGTVTLWTPGFGDYLISITESHRPAA